MVRGSRENAFNSHQYIKTKSVGYNCLLVKDHEHSAKNECGCNQ